MFLFALYAFATWWAAWKFRRQWRGAGLLTLALLGIVVIGWLHYELLLELKAMFYLNILRVLLIPYGLLLAAVGLFLFVQRRTWGQGHCAACGYSLAGIVTARPEITCPECGTDALAQPA
jgi:hypothetical protein